VKEVQELRERPWRYAKNNLISASSRLFVNTCSLLISITLSLFPSVSSSYAVIKDVALDRMQFLMVLPQIYSIIFGS